MAKKTRSELNNIWVTQYQPKQQDYIDVHETFFLSADGITNSASSTITLSNELRGSVYGTSSSPLTSSLTIDVSSLTTENVGQSAVIFHNGLSDPFSTVPSGGVKVNYTYTPGVINIITLIYFSSNYITFSCRSADAASTGAPYATNVTFSGTEQVGQTLTGSYTYNDDEGDLEGTSLFRWLRSSTSNGTFSAIAGATSQTYVLTSADLNQYIRFEVTPVAQSGSTLIGNPVQSASSGQIQAGAWQETDLSDLLTYLTFENDGLITPSGGGLFVEAQDASGTPRIDWVDASGGTAPTYDDANNLLHFISTADRSQINVKSTDAPNLPGLNDARTYAAAYKSDYNNSTFQYLLFVNGNNYFLLENNFFKIRSNGVTYSSTSTVSGIDNQANHIIIVRSDASNNTEVRIDGNIIPGAWSSGNNFNFAINSNCFWGFDGNTTNSYSGDLYKILITSSYMGGTDLLELETKWISDYGL